MSQRLALLISNSSFQDRTLVRLKTPAVDIEALASVLSDPAIGNFNGVEAVIDQPTATIGRRLDQLLRRRQRNDLVLLYLAGHILLSEAGQFYLAAVDTRLDLLAETAIPAGYLTGLMDRSFSQQQILILDCCHSRVFSSIARPPGEADMDLAVVFAGSGYRRVVLSAADAPAYLLAGDKVAGQAEDSVFTHYFIEGLRTGAADADRDGQIGISELFAYVYNQLGQQPARQAPRKWSYYERDEFIIARTPRHSEPEHQVKWDLIFGAIMAPLVTIVIGGQASLGTSVGMAGLFLLFYAGLYWALD